MNFLAHHAIAKQIDPQGTPEFFVGSVLPDLVASSGVGRLRDRHVAGINESCDLVRGIRLHLATDRRFHGLPAFAAACADAKAALHSTPFAVPPTRVFFLAHTFVEIALDGLLLRESKELADDFYGRFAAADPRAITEATRRLLGVSEPLPRLERALIGFSEHRYLYHYATGEGQAEALHRVSLRAGLPGFPEADRQRLARLFDTFTPTLETYRGALLTPPDAAAPVVQ